MSDIISASRRTDIPSFFANWFIERIKAGWVEVVNPFNFSQRRRISLLPDDIIAVMFWTRDARPLVPYLKIIDEMGINYLFLWTLNNYPEILEPVGPKGREAIECAQKLSELVGKEKIRWRYDPVVISEATPVEWHKENFSMLARSLAKFVDSVIVSVMTPYNTVIRRMRRAGINFKNPLNNEEAEQLFSFISEESRRSGLRIQSCCLGGRLMKYGIVSGPCIDSLWIEKVFGKKVDLPKDPGQRPECLCARSIDIGTYNTCKRRCIYCYASK